MNPATNPFSPGAGTQPPELAGRDAVLGDIDLAMLRIAAGRPERSRLLIGLRGTGKTVLLNVIDKKAHEAGFQSVMLEAPEERALADLLVPAVRRVLLRLDDKTGLKTKLRQALGVLRSFAVTFDVKVGDVGVGIDIPAGHADSGNLDSDLTDLLVAVGEAAQERDNAVILLIDELQYVPEADLGALIAALHRVAQLSLPVILFGAGLPQLTGLTGQARSYSERLFVFEEIGPLPPEESMRALVGPIRQAGADITQPALDEIVKVTQGYPYFVQEWGKHAWLAAPKPLITRDDVRAASPNALQALDKSFFKVRLDRLTPSEREYLRGMAALGDGSHRSADIARLLNRSTDQVAAVRAKVIGKGMVYAPAHGDTAFTVPLFDDFLRRVIPVFEPRDPAPRPRRPGR